jgi:hypothetical protein
MAEQLRYFIDSVLTRLSMESGVDTQVYTEDRIVAALQHKFDMLFDSYWFPQFTTFQEEYQLDGVTGQIVGDLTTKVKRFSDLHSIFNDYSPAPLPRAPNNVRLKDMTLPCIQSVPDATKVFRIIPLTSAGPVYVTYRTRPTRFQNDTDVVDMDEQAIILGTCWDIINDDGTNPGAEDKFRMLYNDREKQLTKLQYNFESSGTPRETIPTRWM